jgi:hypothetical protein
MDEKYVSSQAKCDIIWEEHESYTTGRIHTNNECMGKMGISANNEM